MYIQNSRQNRSKNKLARENALTMCMEVARSRLWAPDGCEEDQVWVCRLVFQTLNKFHTPKNVIFHTRFQTFPLKSIFNFERKDQRYEKEGPDHNKESNQQ